MKEKIIQEKWNNLYQKKRITSPFEIDSIPSLDYWATKSFYDDDKYILEFVNDPDSERFIFDIGTGYGTILGKLLIKYPSFTGIGIDISQNAVIEGNKKIKEYNLENRMKLINLSMHEDWKLNRKIDTILCNCSLQFNTLSSFYLLSENINKYLAEDGNVIVKVRSCYRDVPKSYKKYNNEENTYISFEEHEYGMIYHHFSIEELYKFSTLINGRIISLREIRKIRDYDTFPVRSWYEVCIQKKINLIINERLKNMIDQFFNIEINGLESWQKVFQSIEVFSPLIQKIFCINGLKISKISNLTPGSNAVFKVGDYVVKIFAPKESQIDNSIESEVFAHSRAFHFELSVPQIIKYGYVEDKYVFSYLIMEYINGKPFSEVVDVMSANDKLYLGQRLRKLTNKINIDCEEFNNIDIFNNVNKNKSFDRFTSRFKSERLEYIKSHNYGKKVLVHGDLCKDNILLVNNEVYIIDFADSILAPIVYEQALIACELFDFDKWLMKGYFNEYSSYELTQICLSGLLIHRYGGEIINQRISKSEDLNGLYDLQQKIKLKIDLTI
ncbi:MAG: phosphotransferase [Lutisporaceae bacterium]